MKIGNLYNKMSFLYLAFTKLHPFFRGRLGSTTSRPVVPGEGAHQGFVKATLYVNIQE